MLQSLDVENDAGRSETPPSGYCSGQPESHTPHNLHTSPFGSPVPKSVAFELLIKEAPQYRARLPMRVQIFPHDTTDSIITTVKNFYGLYGSSSVAKGVSFEDEHGHTLIARYENLRNNMVVYVRVIDEPAPSAGAYGPVSYRSVSPVHPHAFHPADGQHMPPPQPAQVLSYGQPPSRPASRTSHKRSVSPNRGRRSTSVSTNPPPVKKTRSRSGFKSRGSSAHGSFADIHSDGITGYSSGDGAPGSVSSKTKSEHLGNTEISLDNIVEGGRRKRAKFESSELPLFAPPQMPAATSNSSVSPARRMENQRAFIFTNPNQHPFSNPHPLQSPQNYSNGFGQPGIYTTPAPSARRTRGGASYPPGRQSMGTTPTGNSSGILPTPEPTVGSTMSEEDKDVALQLMRLGEMSNISHGRTSASTFADDTFSGRADAASSTGATSDGESDDDLELPPPHRQKLEDSPILPPGSVQKLHAHLNDILPSQDSTEPSGDEYEDGRDGTFRPAIHDELMEDVDNSKLKMAKSKTPSIIPRPRSTAGSTKSNKSRSKTSRPPAPVKSKKTISAPSGSKGPMSPASLPTQSRKTSVASAINFQHQLGEDEEDLSSKPRCQRCRKSKKGCDRQRPCQRCKDAGLSADQCVSEDEGNGRKGRYGRHMGVPVKKDDTVTQVGIYSLSATTGGQGSPDKSKKRKR
ncbi:transcriptional regulatory protein C56F2.05c [Phlyctema vagabunda]|uniref:Transcriptional regulatory protein C56F2.05c n=1 Tax=Phlyctema vagabunda TaxID=108571 RepID=A0ABR4PJB3_9HELO